MNFVSNLRSENLSESRVNPQKNNLVIIRLSRGPWWLLALLAFVLWFAIDYADNNLYQEAWASIREGIIITIRVSVQAYAIALAMGLALALLRRPSRSVFYNLFVYQPVTTYTELIRGIPTLVLLLYIVFALIPQMINYGNEVGAWLLERNITLLGFSAYIEQLTTRDVSAERRAIFALAVSYSAFLSEIFRAGIESIEDGQREAARSLGMSDLQMNLYIVLPQAIRNVLPPLGNDFIAILKESSLVSTVGVADITNLARAFNSATFTVFPGYNIIALTYLMLTLSLSILVKFLELLLGRSRQRDR
ncbi:MAG: amino acid ABC transporter permease [Anaerolineae bacterium]|nr:amino acid ABC transporter permease [Anaerolineae bacterium]